MISLQDVGWATRERLRTTIRRLLVEPQMVALGQIASSSRSGSRPQFRKLWDAEFRVFSQFGEDGILDFLCTTMDIARPKIMEIGAGNFSECNSRFLAEARGASVYAVDGQRGLSRAIARSTLKWRTPLWAREVWVSPVNAPSLEAEATQVMGGIDILSLDIDGNDYWVLESLSLQEMKIVVVEFNPYFAPRAISVPRNDAFDRTAEHSSWLYYGASLQAFAHLLKSKGFALVGTTRAGNNAFFVLRNLLPLSGLAETPKEELLADSARWTIREMRDDRGDLVPEQTVHAGLEALRGTPVVNVLTQKLEHF
jgi:hypothetical protein